MVSAVQTWVLNTHSRLLSITFNVVAMRTEVYRRKNRSLPSEEVL
jgi:hypothetical protein